MDSKGKRCPHCGKFNYDLSAGPNMCLRCGLDFDLPLPPAIGVLGNMMAGVWFDEACKVTSVTIQQAEIALLCIELEKAQRQARIMRAGLEWIVEGTMGPGGVRNTDGMRDWAGTGSVKEKLICHWLDLASITLKEGSK